MLETTYRKCFSNVSFLSNNTPRSLNESSIAKECPSLIEFGCDGFMVMERLTTTEVDLRWFKHIPHESHHDSILLRSRFNDPATVRRSEGDLNFAYKVHTQSCCYQDHTTC